MTVLSRILAPEKTNTGELIVPADHARVLYYVSHAGIATSAVAYSYGHAYLGSVVAVCVCTSLAYWNRPTYGLRRNIDIACVQVSLWSHTYNAHSSAYIIPYYAVIAVGISAFIASWYATHHNLQWLSIWLHTLVHICAHLSSLCVYLG
jgi:hypothetical protein